MKSEEDTVRFIDQMDEFWHYFEETRGVASEDRFQLFKTKIIQPYLAYYSKVFGLNDDGIKQYIMDIEPKIDALYSSQENILTRFSNILNVFRSKFPAFQTNFDIHLLPSLNLFKGMAVPCQKELWLLLGIDALAELADPHFKGYITHELFHAYHFQQSPNVRDAAEAAMQTMKMPPLWGLLWTEGIACQAVRIVYPEISEEDVLDWKPLVDQSKPLLPDLVREARRVLRSDLPQDIAGFFYFPRGESSNIPTGCGYYLGMLVAAKLTKKHAVDTLIRMEDEELVNEIDTTLTELYG